MSAFCLFCLLKTYLHGAIISKVCEKEKHMTTVLIISALTCVLLMVVAFFKPSVTIKNTSVSIFWIVPFIGALAMILSGKVSLDGIVEAFTSDSAVNPLKILILFISMTLISVYLDCVGFFRFLASAVLKKAGKSQLNLFFYLYITVSVLTVFTSNDIIVLTFTPFICYFAKNAKIDPIPFLITEFIAANTWSMILIIGNPTNIYLATNAGATFADYTLKMALPTVAAGVVSFIVLFLIFRKRLATPITGVGKEEKIKDKPAVVIGLIHLAGAIIMMVISSYINLPMWIIAAGFCISLFVTAAIYHAVAKRGFRVLGESIKRTPLETIPFVLSMFVIVLALQNSGVTETVAHSLSHGNTVLTFGTTSFFAANLINNIPMSVLFSSITNFTEGYNYTQALYASIIGSNLGAFFTPLGALAGIMWTNLLKGSNVRMNFARFTKYGTAVALPTLAASLLTLAII